MKSYFLKCRFSLIVLAFDLRTFQQCLGQQKSRSILRLHGWFKSDGNAK